MEKFIVYFLLLFFGSSVMSMPSHYSSSSFGGTAKLQGQVFKNLTIAGSGNLTEMIVAQLTAGGSLKAVSSTFDSVVVAGSAYFDSCTIKQVLHVRGSCHINNSRVHDGSIFGRATIKDSQLTGAIIIHGRTDLKHCSIDSSLTVRGALVADDCKINQLVSNGMENELKQCTVTGSVEIGGKSHGFWLFITWLWSIFYRQKKQQVILTDTIVQDDITFKDKNDGIVVLNGNSSIQGNVVNGSITHC